MEILNEHQIIQKIRRIAIEILERNYDEQELILAGMNDNGFSIAELLKAEIEKASDVTVKLTNINVTAAAPLDNEIQLGIEPTKLKDKVIIIVDDVANTGRTTFFAMRPLMNVMPKKVEIAVLVNREHKAFPTHPNYVGMSLATTLNENILVFIEEGKPMSATLN